MRLSALSAFGLIGMLAFSVGCDSKGASTPSAEKRVGSPAPDFSLQTKDGATVSMAKLKGKVVLVDFWATWCEPCKASFPKLQELNVKYGAQGFSVVGVSEDEDDSGFDDFLKITGAKFKIGLDPGKKGGMSIVDQYKWEGYTMPSSVLVDKSGVVQWVHAGFKPGDEAELDAKIQALLKQ